MGKGAQAEGQALALAATEPLAASEPSNAADDKETRFMTALQEMTGCDLDDEASVRSAIASLTPLKRQQLLAQGQELNATC